MTIREVAQAAGVGTKTVSRVANDEPNVSPETTARVRAAMAALQWSPDPHASNLRKLDARTRSLGLLLGSVSNPFSASMHRAIEDVAAERDVAVFASSLDEDPDREVRAVGSFLRRKVDGLILTCVASSQAYLHETLRRRSVPVVFIDRVPVDFDGDVVTATNRAGAEAATRHLAGSGHRRIAFLHDRPMLWTSEQRRLGYRDGLAAAGIPADDEIVIANVSSSAQAEEIVIRLFDSPRPPTALFSAQNLITIGAIRALRRLGLSDTVALIGFDDVETGDLLQPGVSVVEQDPSAIGRLAAERLFARLDGAEPSAGVVTSVPTRLILRGSGEIPAPAVGSDRPARTSATR